MATAATPTPETGGITKVVVHPLVLLSVVDHYNRAAKDTKKRAVGVLLGEVFKGQVDVTNSYAVPFEEDPKTPSIWYFDHTYHENMYTMFKKVNAKEKVVGWYSTGPNIRAADIEINELLRRYTKNPILTIIDVKPKDDLEIPTTSYISVENVPEEQSECRRTFVHVPSVIGAEEAEEVGVEHLLRNITDTTSSSVADKVQEKLASLKGLEKRMMVMKEYLENVLAGKLPVNHQVIYNLQDIFNLCPDKNQKELVESFAVKNNDNQLVVYLSSVIRSIIALHNLINNKISNQQHEKREQEEQEADEKKKKEEEKKKEIEEKKKEEAKEGEKKEGEQASKADSKPSTPAAKGDKMEDVDSAAKKESPKKKGGKKSNKGKRGKKKSGK